MAKKWIYQKGVDEPMTPDRMHLGSVDLPNAEDYLPEAPQPKSRKKVCKRHGCEKIAIRQFCSDECRVRHHNDKRPAQSKVAKVCKGCGSVFQGRPDQKTCGATCRSRVFRRGPDSNAPVSINFQPPVEKTMYLITNPEMPGWLKNGESSRSPERRANDMKTSAPSDYVVEKSFWLPEGMSDTDFHPFMAKVAGASNREWFYMPLEVAEKVIRLVMEGREHLIDEMPKCESPGLRVTLHNSVRGGLRIRGRLVKAKRAEALYDANFLAFS